MRIVSRKAIREATAKHREWWASLNVWYKIAKQADWKNLAGVRNSWRNSDVVGHFVVFDISHNRCRLMATSGVSSKAANWGHFKTGQREWPGTVS